ncbi:hypothetical protein D3C76_469750 [compost metagenome]
MVTRHFAAQRMFAMEKPDQLCGFGSHRMQLIFAVELIVRATASAGDTFEPTQRVIPERAPLVIIEQITVGIVFEAHLPGLIVRVTVSH